MKKDITAAQLQTRLQKESLTIIDVRSPLEYRIGHIPNAVNMPLPSLGQDLPGVPKSSSVVMVCKAGSRSSAACERVGGAYPILFNLTGGTDAWIAAGFPVEHAPRKKMSVQRQAHLVAATILILALTLATTVQPAWMYLAALPAFGLTLSALTGFCPIELLLKRMPWNAETLV